MKRILFFWLMLSWGISLQSIAATFTVTNINNAGAGSLRQAILDANASAGADVINFNIAGVGPFTIAPTSALPNITDAVTIDALSQPGASAGSPNVVLNGTSIVIISSNSNIGGLVINGSGTGVSVNGNNNTVYSCFIGTDVTGGSGVPNGTGITISGTGNTIGGSGVAARNIISGNSGYGINMGSSGNTIQGNYIGTDKTGVTAIGNGFSGIYIIALGATTNNTILSNVISGNNDSGIELSNAAGNTIKGNYIGTNATGTVAIPNSKNGIRNIGGNNNVIGGSNVGEGNLVSGNTEQGIRIIALNSGGTILGTGNVLKGNYVGTNASGTSALGNGWGGISITSGDNVIGGSAAGDRNIISGNGGAGITFYGLPMAAGNTVKGNYIGTNAAGTANIGNSGYGIAIASANNIIGGVTAGEKNIIVGNGNAGVQVTGGASTNNNNIRGNNISANDGLGIDLQGTSGIDSNDASDGDTGANSLQNYPILTGVYTNLAVGTFNSTPSSTFTLDFYSNTAADPSGHGEGQTYIGSTTVTTNASGNATFSFSGTFTAGTIISATATNATGSTSEFSGNQIVQNALPVRWLSTTASLNPNKTVSVNWETADEVENKGFEVERSCNGKSFERIGLKSPLKNGGMYEFIDKEPFLGISYYRIKQLDNDGAFSYSRMVSVINDTGIGSYPNPATDQLTITMPQGLVGSAELLDINGRAIKTLPLLQIQQILKLDNMATGTYFLKIFDEKLQVLKVQKVMRE